MRHEGDMNPALTNSKARIALPILAHLAEAFPALEDDSCGIAFASGRRGYRGQEANVFEKSVHDGA